MTPRSGLPWGIVGGLSFLVFLQAYELVTGARVDPVVKFGVAVVVTAAATVLAHAVGRRLGENGRA